MIVLRWARRKLGSSFRQGSGSGEPRLTNLGFERPKVREPVNTRISMQIKLYKYVCTYIYMYVYVYMITMSKKNDESTLNQRQVIPTS